MVYRFISKTFGYKIKYLVNKFQIRGGALTKLNIQLRVRTTEKAMLDSRINVAIKQKESFWLAKGLVLKSKRTPFAW